MSRSGETYRNHARALAQAFGIFLVEIPGMPMEKAAAGTNNTMTHKEVHCAPIVCEVTYIIALHEMGHLTQPGGVLTHEDRSVGLKLHEEETAWAWARYQALDWTNAMEHTMIHALGSYQKAFEYFRRTGVDPSKAAPAPQPPRDPAEVERVMRTINERRHAKKESIGDFLKRIK